MLKKTMHKYLANSRWWLVIGVILISWGYLPVVVANSCTVFQRNGVMVFSDECNIDLRRPSGSTSIVLQFKFVDSSFDVATEELTRVKTKTDINVAMQSIKGGYRLFAGPIQPKYRSQYKTQLRKLGYQDSLIKWLPFIFKNNIDEVNHPTTQPQKDDTSLAKAKAKAVAEQKTAAVPPSVANNQNKKVWFKGVGSSGERHFYLPMSSLETLSKLSFERAKWFCGSLSDKSRIANQQEYVALLSSDFFINELKGSIASPLWLNEQIVVTRVGNQVETRPSHYGVNYPTVCTADIIAG